MIVSKEREALKEALTKLKDLLGSAKNKDEIFENVPDFVDVMDKMGKLHSGFEGAKYQAAQFVERNAFLRFLAMHTHLGLCGMCILLAAKTKDSEELKTATDRLVNEIFPAYTEFLQEALGEFKGKYGDEEYQKALKISIENLER